MRLFRAYVNQLGALRARESIQRINELIYASGHMDKNASRTYMRNLELEAAGPDRRPANLASRPKSVQEMMRLVGSSTKVSTNG